MREAEGRMAHSGGLGFGIFGIGSIAQTHAAAVLAMDGGHLACLGSASGSAGARALATSHGVALYCDLAAFLRHPGLDVVVVATPSGFHLEPTLAAAAAGKHVLCEKPLEVTLERCDAMIAACEDSGTLLGGIFQNRTTDATCALREALDDGRFGRLTLVSGSLPWFRAQSYYDSADWRGTWALDGGGALMNQGIHTVDLICWLAGPVREVSAATACLAHEYIEVEDVAVASLRFESGALGVLSASTAAWPGSAAEIVLAGTKGTARLTAGQITDWRFDPELPGDTEKLRRLGPATASAPGGASDPKAIGSLGHQRQFEDFASAVVEGTAPELDGDEARKAVELVLAVYRSAREGRPVLLPVRS
jgi:UDP-N-acetyl-2-amino-2-deoxyglucuronate dehydrogenase